MDCVNCAANVERALKKVDGVLDVQVNFASEHALVTLAPGSAARRSLPPSKNRLRRDAGGGEEADCRSRRA